jgi:hypothetical protein
MSYQRFLMMCVCLFVSFFFLACVWWLVQVITSPSTPNAADFALSVCCGIQHERLQTASCPFIIVSGDLGFSATEFVLKQRNRPVCRVDRHHLRELCEKLVLTPAAAAAAGPASSAPSPHHPNGGGIEEESF